MPLIRDDHDVDEVERRLSFLEGSRSFVETVREDRSLLVWCLGNVGALAFGGWITYGATEFALEASSMSSVDIVVTLVIAAIGIGTALAAADYLSCAFSSSHDCRVCREESERWEASE